MKIIPLLVLCLVSVCVARPADADGRKKGKAARKAVKGAVKAVIAPPKAPAKISAKPSPSQSTQSGQKKSIQWPVLKTGPAHPAPPTISPKSITITKAPPSANAHLQKSVSLQAAIKKVQSAQEAEETRLWQEGELSGDWSEYEKAVRSLDPVYSLSFSGSTQGWQGGNEYPIEIIKSGGLNISVNVTLTCPTLSMFQTVLTNQTVLYNLTAAMNGIGCLLTTTSNTNSTNIDPITLNVAMSPSTSSSTISSLGAIPDFFKGNNRQDNNSNKNLNKAHIPSQKQKGAQKPGSNFANFQSDASGSDFLRKSGQALPNRARHYQQQKRAMAIPL